MKKLKEVAKVLIGGIEVNVYELNGLRVISALAHPVIFTDEEQIPPNSNLARLIKATMIEEVFEKVAQATLVVATPKADPEAEAVLRRFSEEYPGIRIISSMLSIAAFRELFPGLVIGPITTPETSREAPDKKRCYRDRWSC